MIVNALACLVIILRLMYFNKENRTHKKSAALLAYGMIVCAGFVLFHIITGQYSRAEPAEVLFNVIISVLLVRSKGNVSKLIKGTPNAGFTKRH